MEIKLDILSDLEKKNDKYYFEGKEITQYIWGRLIMEVNTRLVKYVMEGETMKIVLSDEAKARLKDYLNVQN